MVRIVPHSGKIKPAPTLARTSVMGSVQPRGAPLSSGSWLKDRWVLAMHKRQVAQAHVGKELDLGLGLGRVADAVGAIDLFGNGLDLFLDRVLVGVEEVEVGGLLAGRDNGLGQLGAARGALHPDPALGHVKGAGLFGPLADELDLGVGVVLEAVDGDDHRDAEFEGVLDVLQEVGQASLQQLQVLFDVGLGPAACRRRPWGRRRAS